MISPDRSYDTHAIAIAPYESNSTVWAVRVDWKLIRMAEFGWLVPIALPMSE